MNAAKLLVLSLFASSLVAAPPDPGRYSEAKFDVRATRGHKAAMRDGVKLSVDAFQPKAEGKFPAILIISLRGRKSHTLCRGENSAGLVMLASI